MRRLLIFILQLLLLAVVIFLLTAVWIVFDGLTDVGERADVALVCGQPDTGQGIDPVRLDRVIKLHNENEFPFVIVSAPMPDGERDDVAAMVKYLEDHGLPASAIITDHRGTTPQDAAHRVADIMKFHQFESVMLITDYYDVTLTKLALGREGVDTVEKAHVGKLQKEDALHIGREVVAIYDYLGRYYLLPEAEKVKEEAKVGADKAQAEAEKAKQTVDKKIDSMAK